MSTEESKIREELELEVEKDLEEELKDGIHRLAMKLHGLYQHRRERTTKQSSNQQNKHRSSRKTTFSEVNINIKMDGGTTINIDEIKKEAKGRGRKIAAQQVQNVGGKTTPPSARKNKFDWTQSLRSGSSTLSAESRIEGKNRDKENGHDGNIARVGNKIALLEMGWKC